jgi:hypothetical protein
MKLFTSVAILVLTVVVLVEGRFSQWRKLRKLCKPILTDVCTIPASVSGYWRFLPLRDGGCPPVGSNDVRPHSYLDDPCESGAATVCHNTVQINQKNKEIKKIKKTLYFKLLKRFL